MSKISAFILIITIMLITALIGGYAGYSIPGVSDNISVVEPESVGLAWAWDSLTFLFDIIFMQIPEMPVFVSVFFQILSLIGVWLIVSVIRGN